MGTCFHVHYLKRKRCFEESDMINQFKSYDDVRGSLMPLYLDELPFSVKRIFVVDGVPGGCIRGGHAHIKTKQFFLCTSGQIIVYLNNGTRTWIISLKKNQGVEIPPLTWDTQYFCKGASAIVFANTKYDRSDYICEWGEFLKAIKRRTLWLTTCAWLNSVYQNC